MAQPGPVLVKSSIASAGTSKRPCAWNWFRLQLLMLVTTLWVIACAPEEKTDLITRPPPDSNNNPFETLTQTASATQGTTSASGTGIDASTGDSDETADTEESSETAEGDTTAADESTTGDEMDTAETEADTSDPITCADHVCTGHGGCEMVGGSPTCVCDYGYTLDESNMACIVDESCVRFRFLESNQDIKGRCRQYTGGPPAVGLFFGVDFCAGTAVLPEKVAQWREEKGVDFVVLENGNNVLENPESSHRLVPTPVESFVTVVLDVSKSVIGDEDDGTPPSIDLSALVGTMRTFIANLEPSQGDPAVAVAVYVFGRGVAEYVEFTYDFELLDRKLAQIEKDHSFLPDTIGIKGSDLYKAVETGIDRTQRIRDHRAAVSRDGVLTTGTIITITDGNDQSGAGDLDLLKTLNDTVNQVISIGISNAVDDEVLQLIGPDGSFLAPTADDWLLAFNEITQRVAEYPRRAYFLAYCSSRTVGEQPVAISLGGREGMSFDVIQAQCDYDADEFSTDNTVECSDILFDTECDTQECGGLTGCGGCAAGECCNGSQCNAPDTQVECLGQNELCAADDKVCEEIDPVTRTTACVDRKEVGDECSSVCDPGVSYCSIEGVCEPVSPEGSVNECLEGVMCATLNCNKKNPDSSTDPRQCIPQPKLYDYCGAGSSAICEVGAYCGGNDCEPRKLDGSRCTTHNQCRSGICRQSSAGSFCGASDICYYAWDEIVPSAG